MPLTIGSKHVLLHSPEKGWTIEPAVVHIDGSTIKSVQRAPSSQHIAAVHHWFGDDLITPGCVDSHTHLALNFMRGQMASRQPTQNLVEDLFFVLEEKLTAEDVAAFASMGAYESLLSGTTSVWDHYYHADAVADAMIQVGLTGTVAPTLQDLSGPGKNSWEAALGATEALAKSDYHASHGIFTVAGPHATDTVSVALWKRILALSEAHALPIHVHVAQSPEEFLRIHNQHGCSPVELLQRTGVLDAKAAKHLVHMIYASDKDIELCVGKDIRLVACPHSQLIFHFPAAYLEWWKRGIDWAVGTDCGASNDTLRVQAELRTLATWPMTAVSHSTEIADFRRGGTAVQAQILADARNAWQRDFREPLSTEKLLSVLFFGSAQGTPLHPKTAGLAAGSFANLVVWNWDDPVFWPQVAPEHALVFSDVQPALKGIMSLGRWRGS
ncbi:MAG: hypothetical protein RIR26_2332, partial [Pseudomonadota bacterium]